MNGKRTDFLYLSEPDMIEAGVLDMSRCVDVTEEVFSILSTGDYLMGGPKHNSHGMGIVFPKETPFPNMPVAGPDRRFVAMPAYLGGRFGVCGVKWYGSNAANPPKGLPRSVLTVLLNDKDTGEPLCFMSANLISAMRTGAVPGVGTRYLSRKDSEACSVIGCGPINQSCFHGVMSQMKGIKKVLCYDLYEEKSKAFAELAAKEFGVEAYAAATLEEAMRAGDVITIAASRLKPLILDSTWLKKGVTILLSGPARGDDALWINSRLVYDHVQLHEAYVEEAIASGNKAEYYAGVIGGQIYTLIDEGKIQPLEDSVSLGDIVNGKNPGRQNGEENIIFIACGMAVYDIAWGYDLYKYSLEKGIGTKLNLWNEPLWK